MSKQWQVVNGTGWLEIPNFGRINPRRDDVGGGRQFFTVLLQNGEQARVRGKSITRGPETWHFEFDEVFLLADRGAEDCLEAYISLLPGGIYSFKFRRGTWAPGETGGW